MVTESVEPPKGQAPAGDVDAVLDAMAAVKRPEQSVIDRIGALVDWQLARGESGNRDGMSCDRRCRLCGGAPIDPDLGICGECISDRDLAV